MSITSVNSQIKSAMRDAFITKAEAQKIVKEAEKGPVTVGEARLVRELFERAPTPPPPGMMVTMAIPENPNDVIFEQGAKSVLETFFTKNNVPAGANVKKFVEQIQAKLSTIDYGSPLAAAPDTKKLHLVRLPSDPRIMDAPTENAFVDTKKNEFYLCVNNGFLAPSDIAVQWFGPISLDKAPAAGGVTAQRQAQLLSAFETAESAGGIGWKAQGMPVGGRFERVALKADGHPDGYNYTALIPVGALSPTAPVADPNKVPTFFVERSGGFAGITMTAGPFTANVLPGDGSGWGHGADRPRPTGGN
jgi:hypothetical protein